MSDLDVDSYTGPGCNPLADFGASARFFVSRVISFHAAGLNDIINPFLD
jgi:hypothetical protein